MSKGSFIGDVGTASVLKFEKRTSVLLSPKGHYQKAKEMKRHMEKIISKESLSKKDKKKQEHSANNFSEPFLNGRERYEVR